MLSWSGIENGTPVDIGELGEGRAPDHPWSAELHAFASAAVALDDDLLARTRDSLVTVADVAVAIDAAAVVANFEMMTRLADGTGARMPDEAIHARGALITAMRMADVTSRR